VVRGVHFADVPPGQAKHVTCLAGAVLDVAVDLRVGSPTFGRWHAERLDAVQRRALYLPEGIGHAFCALADDATVVYLCSEPYRPAAEHGVHLDPALGLPWPDDVDLVLSAKDAEAPLARRGASRRDAAPSDACLAHAATLTADATGRMISSRDCDRLLMRRRLPARSLAGSAQPRAARASRPRAPRASRAWVPGPPRPTSRGRGPTRPVAAR
jgi:dTDP-4-dehydrorhamnose 3,5-epimerase